MKRFFYPILLLVVAFTYVGCEDYETYADKKEKEHAAITNFIAKEGIQVISESQFASQGNTTDVAKNQYVHFDRNGVYMQIVRMGCGEKLEENQSVNISCRFYEKNILTDSILIRNDKEAYITLSGTSYNVADYVDKMTVKRTGTTITASFITGMMVMYHSSASVPAGWLVPLNYVNIGRPDPASDDSQEISLVRLIVPHSQGTVDASSSVYPCFYEITYERTR